MTAEPQAATGGRHGLGQASPEHGVTKANSRPTPGDKETIGERSEGGAGS